MSKFKAWTGSVTWKLDNKGVVDRWPKTGCLSPSDWTKSVDRDIYSYIHAIKPVLCGKWHMSWVKGHPEKRKKQSKFNFSDTGNFISDKLAAVGLANGRMDWGSVCCPNG